MLSIRCAQTAALYVGLVFIVAVESYKSLFVKTKAVLPCEERKATMARSKAAKACFMV